MIYNGLKAEITVRKGSLRMKTLRIPSGVTAVKLSWSRILPMLLLAALLSGCGAQAQPAEPSPKPVQELPADAVVSYLGPAGTYTEQAAELLFSQSTQLQPRATVAEALDDVMEGRADYAVIPQENTIGGPVYDYLDEVLNREGLSVHGEVELPIRQALLAPEGTALADIRTVYSHKQGIAQGSAWLKEHLPDAEVVEVSSTAEGARLAAEEADGSAAAIASTQAARVYGLSVLAESIQQNDNNVTRFYLVSTRPGADTGDRMVFSAAGPADALPGLLRSMEEHSLTLVALHDRTAKTTLGSYVWLVECSGGGKAEFAHLETENSGLTLRYRGAFQKKMLETS